ncbi:hypothetical protein E3O44_00045 [Cryobacterium algoricola]|uniref:PH domain-containing protein n=1 Tax=Cryobacterium algoricola TaxID=1259183 RepID=A0ABY2II49_9MICO|nr:hypothetical protein [Cryobacterium algoricola]TFB91292.1 hypothetical protein E3O44_00045 [Cryobacterium algoricola]
MAIETSAAPATVVLRPRRWRFWASVVLVVLTSLSILMFVFTNPDGPKVAWVVALLIPGAITVRATGVLSRSVRIVPGSHLEYRDLLFRRRRIECGSTTEILYFSDVAGSGPIPIRPLRTPIGVIDERWAVLRNDRKTVLRLSMWLWTMEDLLAIAQLMPAKLKIHAEHVSPRALARRHPTYYTWFELSPVRFEIVFLAVALWEGLAIVVGFALALRMCGLV